MFVISLFCLVLSASACLAQSQTSPGKDTGTFVKYENFHSKYLTRDRTIRVWLPPGYEGAKKERYPVFYLHDGQNLFKGGPSFIPNQSWNADTTASELIQEGKIRPLILVGIDNAGKDRLSEYTPTEVANFKESGKGASYKKMLIEELKPFIDSHFRTRKGASDTGLGGASLGGLISLQFGLDSPKVFGKLAVMSPSLWWDSETLVRRSEGLERKLKLKIWLDVGLKEGDQMTLPARKLRASLLSKGWKEGGDLQYQEGENDGHNEKAWASRFPQALIFLFGK